MKHRPLLNARQRAFVRHYAAGSDGVRGNATQAYIAAGYATKNADVFGPRLMANDQIIGAIMEAHRRADAEAIGKLRDWKAMAPEIQDRLLNLARGVLPGRADPSAGMAMASRDDAAIAAIIRDACKEILDRAYPKKLLLGRGDPREDLARMLGCKIEDLPEEDKC